jgi:hypothetical protein
MTYHIVKVQPDPRLHGINGYDEVVETLAWGLAELGFAVSTATNDFAPDKTNIVLGFQMLPEAKLVRLPETTVLYNFEQMRGVDAGHLKPAYRIAAERFRIWDYSRFNMDAWQGLGPRFPVRHVPVGYAPILTRIAEPAEPDIDVLIYGLPGAARLAVFQELCRRGAKCVFVCGLYGAARDGLIARAKLVLNIHLYEWAGIFEVVRVSYLLANRKAVVANRMANTRIEPDLMDAVVFTPLEALPARCLRLLDDDKARAALAARGFAAMAKRDIRGILAAAVDAA